jgi:hypothetical protein
MNFGEVLSRAWQIVWRHKVLWIFGILTSCGGNTNGGASSNYSVSTDTGALPPQWQSFFDQWANLPGWQIALIVGAVLLVILALVVLAIFLGTIGRVGLIRGTQLADQGAQRMAFGELFGASLPYFWRVFGLNFLFGLAIFVLVLLIVAPFILLAVFTMGLGALCVLPLICVLVPLAWFATVVVEQGSVAIVVDNLGIGDGFRRGWELVRSNLGSFIVMALILLLGVGLIGSAIIALPLGLVVLPAIVGTVADTPQVQGGGYLTAALCFVAYLPILLVLSGILRAYIGSAWTLTYLRLRGRSVSQDLVAA